jgi:DNA-binding response OmpR family regulator
LARQPKQTLRKVLIVEDDGLLAVSLEDAFHAAGVADVRISASAAEAMEEIAEIAPQVMVLDVNLADRNDGWALAELSRELFDRPPLIIFSTGSPEAIPDEVKEMGVVMTKPYAPDDLVAEAIRQAPRSMLSRLLGQR